MIWALALVPVIYYLVRKVHKLEDRIRELTEEVERLR